MVGFLNVIILSICVLYVNCFALPFEGLFKVDIIHFNDFHARFLETSLATPTCRVDNNSCLGGFPRLFYEIETLLKEKPDSILLNAGDSFQGTYWYTLLKWNVTQEFMNLLPHDAHAIGNHEFDDGPSGLAPYLKHLKAPVLAANMDTSQEPTLQGLYQPHIVIERNRRKIGIIGLITPDTASLSQPGNVTFSSCQDAAKREATILTGMGVDIIVLLSHCGLEVDKEIARDCGEWIDVIIGGHSHSLLWNGPTPSGEVAAGPYPVFVQSAVDQRHQTLIVQASAFTKYVGNLSVNFNYRGDYVSWEGGPIFLNRSIPEDANIKARLEPYASIVRAAEDVPIGYTEDSLSFEDCAFGECVLGDLMVDAFNEQAETTLPAVRDFVAFVQRGDIKSSLVKGNITQGEVFELLPYNDRLQSFELEGKYVREALERSVAEAWATDPFKGPWVLQVSGIQVSYNISQPEGQRVTSVTVGSTRAVLDDAKWYQVTTPSYLGDGGDGYTMFKGNRRNMEIIGRDQTVVENYIKKRSPIRMSKSARITITY